MSTKYKLAKKAEMIKDLKCRYCNSSIDISQQCNVVVCLDNKCEKKRKAEAQKKWAQNNPAKCNAASAKRRATKLNATPNTLTDEDWDKIEEFYTEAQRLSKETGISHHVDHIKPLIGRDGSRGEHAPWNLQVITQEENRKKSNKLII